MIPYRVKAACIEAKEKGKTAREIYQTIFLPEVENPCGFPAFQRAIRKWRRKYADPDTLDAGTYEGFTVHGATVQVDKRGNVTQAWIKQHTDIDWQQIVQMLEEGIEPILVQPCETGGESMLEIPLFDQHFGTATYPRQLEEILGIIGVKAYDEINLIFGQDVLHTNDLRGHTAKGTEIGAIDFPSAWTDAWQFWTAVIRASLEHSRRVRVWYSKGNHDECSAWCLFKALQVAFPGAEFDADISPRKCLTWQGCFVGFGHCEYTGQSGRIFQNFVMDFPKEFANAAVREIHTGHLHRESIDSGIMVRRLATAAPATEWEKSNGLTGAHKRFQLFEWLPGRLKAIYYV